ncbi:hypothetical protein BXZ70DRAFT_1011562 [Cristinia sonorae]|uniref:C2H2-type domain-containing protein n=1 Tax=Cristinia sonorae TaxID=1940300 RepID=A0A8K0XLB4_9AGAR|nr:hypothetical protein BXZ70DRAFT_1011562 [Cristinia sonorae]
MTSQSTQTQDHQDELTCTECGARLARKFDLRRHMLTHSKDVEALKYHCPYEGCKTSCLQRGNLITHMKRHSGTKDILCPHDDCTWSTGDPAALTRHRKVKHGYTPSSRAPRDKTVKKEKVTRYRPYGRVAPATELKLSFKTEEHEIALAFSEPSPASSSSSASLSSISSLSSGYMSDSSFVVSSLSPSPDASGSSSKDQLSLAMPSYQVDSQDIFGLSPVSGRTDASYAQPAFHYGESSVAGSGIPDDTDFSHFLASIASEPFFPNIPQVDATNPFFLDNASMSMPMPMPANSWSMPATTGTEWDYSATSPSNSVFSEPHTPAADDFIPDTSFMHPQFAVMAHTAPLDFNLDFSYTQ